MAKTNRTLRINNKAHEGYRRAGVAFVKGVNDVAASSFNADQLAALKADPRLEVAEVNQKAATKTAPKKGAVDDGSLDTAIKKALKAGKQT